MSWYEEYLAQMQLPPEWSISKQSWQPLDAGWYEDNQDYQRQAMQMMMDPMAGFMSGGFSPESLQDTVEIEEVSPAVTEGTDTLTKIVETSDPRSPRRIVAAALLSGQSPEQAMQTLRAEVELGSVDVSDRKDKDGELVDLAGIQSFAQSGWEKLMSDREAVSQEKVTPNPMVQTALDAGFTDPRQRYTADYLDPNLAGARESIRGLEGAWGAQAALNKLSKGYEGADTESRAITEPLWQQRRALAADEGRANNVARLYEALYGSPMQMEMMQRSGLPMPEVPRGLFYETPSGPPPMERAPKPRTMSREASGYGGGGNSYPRPDRGGRGARTTPAPVRGRGWAATGTPERGGGVDRSAEAAAMREYMARQQVRQLVPAALRPRG